MASNSNVRNKMETDIKAKVKTAIEAGAKSVELSEADLAAFAKKDEAAQRQKEMLADVVIEVPDGIKADPVLETAQFDTTTLAAEQLDETEPHLSDMDKLSEITADVIPSVTITYEDKQAFLASLVHDTRFKMPFNLFGGAITGLFRSRLQAESTAIFAQLEYERRAGLLDMNVAYSMRLRNMLLATQIEILNNETYPELKQPYLPIIEGLNRKTLPGWLAQADTWAAKPEAIVKALYGVLKEFEYKYLVMLEHATDQNFWKTATYS